MLSDLMYVQNKTPWFFQSISGLDKTDVNRAIIVIQQAHHDIEGIAQENDIPILRAIIHWMSLNTEIDVHNQQQIQSLLESDSYSNWIDVLSNLLDRNDFKLLPLLHQSLTSPDWIVRPSALLLKGVATWLTEIKLETEKNVELHDQSPGQEGSIMEIESNISIMNQLMM
jgi:hypothetical protein